MTASRKPGTKAQRQAWWRSLTQEQQAERIRGWEARKTAERTAVLSAEQMRIRDLAQDLSVPFDPAWLGPVTECDDVPPWLNQGHAGAGEIPS